VLGARRVRCDSKCNKATNNKATRRNKKAKVETTTNTTILKQKTKNNKMRHLKDNPFMQFCRVCKK
jgi:hypothetical protein